MELGLGFWFRVVISRLDCREADGSAMAGN